MAKKTKKPDRVAARQDEERFNFHLGLSSGGEQFAGFLRQHLASRE
jgi:hypothetical protein